MISFFLFVIFLILFIGLFIIMAVLGFVRSIFGFGKRKPKTQESGNDHFGQSAAPRPKIFDKKDGEYVDFEEI